MMKGKDSKEKKKNRAKDNKRAEISSPTDFQHMVHGVWDPMENREYTTLPRAKASPATLPRRTEPTKNGTESPNDASMGFKSNSTPEQFQIMPEQLPPKPHMPAVRSQENIKQSKTFGSKLLKSISQGDITDNAVLTTFTSKCHGVDSYMNKDVTLTSTMEPDRSHRGQLPSPPSPCGSKQSSEGSKHSSTNTSHDTGTPSGRYVTIPDPFSKEYELQQLSEQVAAEVSRLLELFKDEFRDIIREEVQMAIAGKSNWPNHDDADTYMIMKNARRSTDDADNPSKVNFKRRSTFSSTDTQGLGMRHPRGEDFPVTERRPGSLGKNPHRQLTIPPKPAKRNQGRLREYCEEDRECVAMALQECIIDFTEKFHLLDQVLESLVPECLTADEYQGIQRLDSNKDRMRKLVSLIRGRDVGVIVNFLMHIKRYEPSIVEALQSVFEKRKEAGTPKVPCGACLLKNRVDIKYIADRVWMKAGISDGLYNQIICCSNPFGAQEHLWTQLFEECNRDKILVRARLNEIIQILSDMGHYHYIAEELKCLLDVGRVPKIACFCEGNEQRLVTSRHGKHSVVLQIHRDRCRDAVCSRASDDIARLYTGNLNGNSLKDTDEYKIRQWRTNGNPDPSRGEENIGLEELEGACGFRKPASKEMEGGPPPPIPIKRVNSFLEDLDESDSSVV